MSETGEEILGLLREVGPELHALLTRLTLREDVAEDLLQDLFIRLAESRQFRKAENPGGYARRVAMHLAFDWRRHRRRYPEPASLAKDPKSDELSPLDQLVGREELEQLLEVANGLNPLRRDVFVMRFIQEESYEEIARQLSRSPHQIRGLCSKAVEQVRMILERKSAGGGQAEACHVAT